jgi:hypothetical protein
MNSSDFVRPDQSRKERPSRFGTLTTRTLALGLALAFVLGACDVYALPAGGGSGGENSGDLTLSVTEPADGAEVSIPFEVTLESDVALGPPESGNRHVHLFFDTDTDSADYDIVYGNTAQVTRELAPGEHTIIASLRNPDHGDAGPSQTISVIVTGSGGDATAPDPVAPPAGFDY